ncbi:MAG: hypothetical protein M1274_15755, partial [Actinobacteria bacterium]|nr:hypothetical protein [Actinomycetota bacterium]
THYLRQAFAGSGTHTARYLVKPGGRTWVRVLCFGLNKGVYFQLTDNGTVGTASAGLTGTISSLETGWYLITVSGDFSTTGQMDLYLANADNSPSYSGIGHQGVAAAGGSTTMAVLAAGASTVDDVYSHCFAAASANKNLVWPKAASDFSNGWLSGWAPKSGSEATVTYDATNGVDNGGCVKVECSTTGLGATNSVAPYPIRIPVIVGLPYSLSMSAKGAVGGERIAIGLEFLTDAGAWISSSAASMDITNAHARVVLNNVVAPATAAFCRVTMISNGAAVASTFYVDEIQIEQAAAATAYIAPTQGALWSDAGAKGVFSDAPTVEHSATGYNGGTKEITFTPARAAAPDGTTYTFGPGIYIARAQLGEGTSLLPYEETTTRQTITSKFGKPYSVIRGADTTASTTDPTLKTGSMSFDGGDYLRGGESQPAWSHGFDVAWYAPAAVNAALAQQYLVGLPGSNTDGMYIGNGGLTNEIIALVQEGGTPTAAWCHGSDELAIGWHVAQWTWTGAAWRLFVDGAEKTLTTAGTQAKFTTAGVPFIGSTKVPGTYLAAGTLVHAVVPYSAPRSVSELARCRRYIKGQAAIAGVSLP